MRPMPDASPGKLTQIIGSFVVLLFSFLPWYSGPFGFSVNAWDKGLFPMASWAPLFAIAVGFIVAARTFKFVNVPEKVWEFTMDQVVVVLSIFTLLITLSYLISSHGGSIGFGLILCLLGAIAMVAGFFMDRAGVGVNPNAGAPGYHAPMDGNPPGSQGFPPPGQPQAPQQQPYPQQPAPQAPQAPQQPYPESPQQTQIPGQSQVPQQPPTDNPPQPGSF
jgi:hypothetical protein